LINKAKKRGWSVGIYDRDWYKDAKKKDEAKESWYDPKQFRNGANGCGNAPPPYSRTLSSSSSKRPPNLIKTIAGWLLLLLVLYFLLSPSIDKGRKTERPFTHSTLTSQQNCTPNTLPPNGATQVADPSRMRRTDVLFSGLEIENKHQNPVVAYLTDLGTGQRVLGISVQPGKTAQASVPVGNYGLFFFAGSSWCNSQIGFKDGQQVNVQGGIEIQSGGTSVLSLASAGSAWPERFHISASHRLPQAPKPVQPEPDVRGAGFVDLVQRPDGHYYAAGYVNGMPIVFMVDTGATLTSLSQEMAHKSGIYSCVARTFNTANGSVQGCVAKAPKIQIGNFVLRDFEVAVMPNLPTDALLGMNILRMYRLEQQSGVMRISSR
jgi:clan AA aspartic protease (TIGR02281 family)